LKITFFDFTRYSGYSMQVRWANVQAIGDKSSQDSTHKNH